MQHSYPAYLDAFRDGSLRARAEEAIDGLRACSLCPRRCGADRLRGEGGACRTGRRARVASWGAHHGEERVLSGRRGSGTIFFSGCNLACVFCQNAELSQAPAGRAMDDGEIAGAMLDLQERGCHNLNLVTPSHVLPQVLEALLAAAANGLDLPIVWNSSGNDGEETLALLAGIVDIYMPDFKVWDPEVAGRLLGDRRYPESARGAIRAMHRQVGPLEIGPGGLARRGVLVRHLVMPGLTEDAAKIFRFLAEEVSPETYINVMSQYRPAHRSGGFPEIDRPITASEVRAALAAAKEAGLHRFDL